MADRGTAYSATADQYELDVFTHVQEPWAAFPEAGRQEVVDTTFETAVETWAPYGIAGDPPVNWSDQFDVPHGGDGFYMQEPNTHDKKLQGAPNGRATIAGALSMDLGLGSAVAAGRATVPPPTLRKNVPLSGSARGKAWAGSGYTDAILFDEPSIYARLNDIAGDGVFNNHPALGGGPIGSFNGSVVRSPGLIETASMAVEDAARASTGSLFIDSPGIYDEWSVEFWTKVSPSSASRTLFSWTASLPSEFTSSDRTFLQVQKNQSNLYVLSYWTNQQDQINLASLPIILGDNRVHQLVFTYRRETTGGATLTFYFDGIEYVSAWVNFPLLPQDAVNPSSSAYMSDPVATIDDISIFPYALAEAQVKTHYQAAWFVPPYQGQATGRATVAGALGLRRQLSGQAHGNTAIGVAGPAEIGFDSLALPNGAQSYYQSLSGAVQAVAPAFVDRELTYGDTTTTKALRQWDITDGEKAWTDFPFDWGGTPSDALTIHYFVGSEFRWDTANFYLDGATTPFWTDSGNTSSGWEVATRTGLASGPHTLRIEYTKDGSFSSFIDNVDVGRISYVRSIGPTLDIAGDVTLVPLAGGGEGVATVAGDLIVVLRRPMEGQLSTKAKTPLRRAFS